MQSSTSVSAVSPAEDLFGRLTSRGLTLRGGQRDLIQYVSDHPEQSTYNGVMPTGYGKSKAAEGVCDVVKAQGRANRFLIVVPTDTQRSQYAEGIAKDVDEYGFNLKLEQRTEGSGVTYAVPVVISHTERDLRANFENRCEVFVTTIQGIHANQGWYRDFMAKGSWLVFADEYQKLNREDSAKWGKALEALNWNVLLGLTATPVRTDRKQTVFADKTPDVCVEFNEAYLEEAIRRVVAHIEHYFVDVVDGVDEDGKPVVNRVTTENINDYDLSRDLRFSNKYFASIISSAQDCLLSKNHAQPGQHQMLVFAMGVAHAKNVCDVLNVLYGNGYADWIGVGPDGRSPQENKRILKAYKDNKLLCLVQVDIAGEGFDNPRSSVLVFLNLLRKSSVKAVQQAGRGLRRNRGITEFKDDVCDIFASPDTEMAALIRDLAQQTLDISALGQEAGEPNPDADSRNTPIFEISPMETTVKDSEYDRSEIISKIPQQHVDRIRQRIETADGKPAADTVTDDRIRSILADDKIEQLRKAQAMEDRPETQKTRVMEATKILVGNVLRLRYGSSQPKGAAGDLHRVLNTEWKRHMRRGHDSMTDEDFALKHKWIEGINAELQLTRSVPRWLVL